jgi:hypothetical protein
MVHTLVIVIILKGLNVMIPTIFIFEKETSKQNKYTYMNSQFSNFVMVDSITNFQNS